VIQLDGITTKPPTCIFCGTSQGPFHVEDVLPKWLRKVLPRGDRVEYRRPGRKTRNNAVLQAKLKKAVCRRCNGGWMSVLENATKPIIADMIYPDAAKLPIHLDGPAQRMIAFWAVEKALCLELSMRQSLSDFPGGHLSLGLFRWLYEHREQREPPPGTQVWLFVYHAQETRKEAIVATLSQVPLSGKEEHPQRAEASLSTFTVGCLGFQVFVRDLVESGSGPLDRDPLVPPESFRPWMLQIWPIVEPTANWAPNGAASHRVTAATLPAHVTWGPTLQPTSHWARPLDWSVTPLRREGTEQATGLGPKLPAMRIEWFMLCQQVAQRDGFWDIQGAGTETVTIHSFPNQLQLICCVALPYDQATHRVVLEHFGPDGQPAEAAPVEFTFTLNPNDPGTPTEWDVRQVQPLAVTLREPNVGIHTYRLTTEDGETSSVEILVKP
jgi:hypothetical protein